MAYPVGVFPYHSPNSLRFRSSIHIHIVILFYNSATVFTMKNSTMEFGKPQSKTIFHYVSSFND